MKVYRTLKNKDAKQTSNSFKKRISSKLRIQPLLWEQKEAGMGE
ncbi:hypothetical protein ACEQPO_03270 [Bacillus sp. SL00103]